MKNHKKDCICCICKNKRNKKHLDKDILYQKYITEHKSMSQCSEELNCSVGFVHGYLKKYNIPTRAYKAYKVWNKGLDKTDPRVKKSVTAAGEANKGTIPWNKGLTKETDSRVKKQAETYSKTHKDFSGENNPFYGKNHTNEWRFEQSLRKGGTGRDETYGPEFTYALKEEIRNKYDRKCVLCGLDEADNNKGKRLEVHHIDYDKFNNEKENLVPLCKGCHVATNTNRKKWQQHFRSKILWQTR